MLAAVQWGVVVKCLVMEPREAGASAGSLVGRIRVPKTEALAHSLAVKPDPGVSACLLSGRPGSWSLAAGPRDPRAHLRSLSGRQFMIPLSMGTKVSGGCVNLLVVRARAS